ncbi:uncharacterized protein G2W53_038847 [Senna tora]|uniref:Uncharacterized protein n=1 Tax=Senna tora TaxID=362788 RepID=A0A834SN47_9FABA|nr:uncharacterized protein G2W53_038847 [Senna tora]
MKLQDQPNGPESYNWAEVFGNPIHIHIINTRSTEKSNKYILYLILPETPSFDHDLSKTLLSFFVSEIRQFRISCLPPKLLGMIEQFPIDAEPAPLFLLCDRPLSITQFNLVIGTALGSVKGSE